MPELRPWSGAVAYPLHQSWMAQCLSDLDNAALRKEIWKSKRFSNRIVDSLLGDSAGMPSSPLTAGQIEAVIQASSQSDMLRRLGLSWMAPVLAGYLLNTRTRNTCGPLSKNEMQYVLDARAHAPVDLIDPIIAGADPADQGLICLATWLATLQVDVADRVRLLLPIMPPVPLAINAQQSTARADLVWSVFGGDV